MQAKVKEKAIDLRKARGDCNPADLLTKHLVSREKLEDLVKLFGGEYRSGRAACAPYLRRTPGTQQLHPTLDADPELLSVVIPKRPDVPDVDEDGVREAAVHDRRSLLHHYPNEAIEWMFSAAEPPDDERCFEDFLVPTATRSPSLWRTHPTSPSAGGAAAALQELTHA